MTLNLHRVDGKVVGFHYPYRECVKRFIGCLKWEQKSILFPFSDESIMNTLYDKDFVLSVRKIP